MSDKKCLEYVLSHGMYVTCRCILDPHDKDVPHVCRCKGSWFGEKGNIDKVVEFPELIDEWLATTSRHGTPRIGPHDPARHLLSDDFKTTPKVFRDNCYICKDMEFARLGMPLCNLCCACAALNKEGHIAADDQNCDDCGHRLCKSCYDLPPQKAPICSCDSPCCEVDVGVGIITCGSYHCPTHGEKADEGKAV